MELPQYLEQAIDDIDSTLFSGDFFHEKETLAFFKGYLERWAKRCSEIEGIIEEESK